MLIFCDEPTTGLDSFNAMSVIQALKSLTQQSLPQLNENSKTELFPYLKNSKNTSTTENLLFNKAVICAIHQPPSNVFECFSHVILMHGGHIVFQGTVQQASTYYSG